MQHRVYDGFALTEVLVATSLLVMGLLGHLGLLVAGVQVERDAANLATATTLAADMGERIRANRAGGLGYAIDPNAPPVSPPTGCTIGVPIDASTRANCDTTEWQREVEDALPGAEVRLESRILPDDTAVLYSIEIRWTAWRNGSDGRCSLQLQV